MHFLKSIYLSYDNIISVFTDWMGSDREMLLIGIVFLLIIGSLLGFSGYIIHRLIRGISNALFFGIMVYSLLFMLNIDRGLMNNITFCFTAIGLLFGYFINKAGDFLQGLFIAFTLSLIFIKILGLPYDSFYFFLSELTIAIIIALLGLINQKATSIVLYSLVGALMIAFGVRETFVLLSRGDINIIIKLRGEHAWLLSFTFLLIIMFFLAIVFVLFQRKQVKKLPQDKQILAEGKRDQNNS